MERVSVDIVKRLTKGNEKVPIINVLEQEIFNKEHIPGSTNIPLNPKEDFVQRVESILPSKHQKLIVYCAHDSCDASVTAADLLDHAGFSEVLHFDAGMKGWKDAGLDAESSI